MNPHNPLYKGKVQAGEDNSPQYIKKQNNDDEAGTFMVSNSISFATQRWHTALQPEVHPVRTLTQIVFPTRLEARQRAARLILACLDDERQLNFAFTYWPLLSEHRQDTSLNVAYQMLWHFECDAGVQETGPHKTEAFYADIQFELLKEVARFLEVGEALPWEMLEVYQRYEPAQQFRPTYYNPWWRRMIYAAKSYILIRYTQFDSVVKPLFKRGL
jgi:hypothetical protein